MSYCWPNYRTKKALKEAVQKYNEKMEYWSGPVNVPSYNEGMVSCFNPGLGGDLSNHTGKVYLEGPHYPLPHTWYAQGEMVDGKLVNVS